MTNQLFSVSLFVLCFLMNIEQFSLHAGMSIMQQDYQTSYDELFEQVRNTAGKLCLKCKLCPVVFDGHKPSSFKLHLEQKHPELGKAHLTLYTNRPSTDFGLGTLRWTFEMFQVLFEFEIKFPEEWWAFR